MKTALFALLCFFSFPFAAPARAQEAKVPESREQISLSYAPLVRSVAPAVVSISSRRVVAARLRNPFIDDPFFAPFFNNDLFSQGGLTRQRVESALGSGVIVDSDGLVATNAHVVQGADEITVTLADGRELPGKVALKDDPSDLALLRIGDGKETFPSASLKPADMLEVGDLVLAFGNPFGVGQTVTSGIVSALARPNLDINDYNFFIQTDAAINPGNSGGPLVAMDGSVVGINSAIYSRDGGSLGIGFAIPSEMVAVIVAAEKAGQTGDKGIARAWLGITAQELTADIAQSMGLEAPAGVLVAGLHPESPALEAGLRVGDVVTALDGHPVRNPAEMKFRWAMAPIGSSVEFIVQRKGNEDTVSVQAMLPPDNPPRNETTLDGRNPLSGATIANINPAVCYELGLDENAEGVVVVRVDRRTRASQLVGSGDILQSVNGLPIKDVGDVEGALENRGRGINIVVNSHGQTRQILIR